MDQETVIVLCAIFTVVIGIIELTRKKGNGVEAQEEPGNPQKVTRLLKQGCRPAWRDVIFWQRLYQNGIRS